MNNTDQTMSHKTLLKKRPKTSLISQLLLISLLVALLHIAFDHNPTDLKDVSPDCDVCRLVQIDAASASTIPISLDKYTRTDFSPVVPYRSSGFRQHFLARAPPAFI